MLRVKQHIDLLAAAARVRTDALVLAVPAALPAQAKKTHAAHSHTADRRRLRLLALMGPAEQSRYIARTPAQPALRHIPLKAGPPRLLPRRPRTL